MYVHWLNVILRLRQVNTLLTFDNRLHIFIFIVLDFSEGRVITVCAMNTTLPSSSNPAPRPSIAEREIIALNANLTWLLDGIVRDVSRRGVRLASMHDTLSAYWEVTQHTQVAGHELGSANQQAMLVALNRSRSQRQASIEAESSR